MSFENAEDRDELISVRVLGIVTFENVIEKLLQTEISDEKDRNKMKLEANLRGISAATRNDMLSQISAEDQ